MDYSERMAVDLTVVRDLQCSGLKLKTGSAVDCTKRLAVPWTVVRDWQCHVLYSLAVGVGR